MDKELLLYHYFSDQLSKAEEELFNELLQSDPEFKSQFDFENDLKRAIRQGENEQLKAKLADFEQEITRATPVRTLWSNYKKWSFAASIALLVGLGWLGLNFFSGPDYADLYRENFQEYPNTVFTITRGESVESIERDGFAAYERGNYQTAIENFNKIPVADRAAYLDFYLAQAHLGLGQLTEAKTALAKTIVSESHFSPEAHWYLALISIKEKDKATAKTYLKQLTTKFDYNKEQALELLKELD